jgi:hypothetical protein
MGRPARWNVDLVRGDSKTYTLSFTDGGGTAINITTWVIYYTVKEELNDTDAQAAIRKIITVHTDPTHGISDIVLENSDTQTLKAPQTYWHDIQVDIAGKINTIMFGQLNVIADVTRTH